MKALIMTLVLFVSINGLSQSYTKTTYDNFGDQQNKETIYGKIFYKYDSVNKAVYIKQVDVNGKTIDNKTYRVFSTSIIDGTKHKCQGVTIVYRSQGGWISELSLIYSDGSKVVYNGVTKR